MLTMALQSTPPPAQSSKQSHADLQEREEAFTELIKRANILECQIVQRVDVIQEDHGKAIRVFTIVSVIFLPLSFVSSYPGMNTADIRNMELNQALF
jgi:Mg2+ and Co2+ transporter CorA